MDAGVLPEEFLQILRLSLKSSDHLISTLEAPAPGTGQIRKIIEAILWHRKFVLTYYAVVGLVIALACGHGLSKKALRWHRNRRKNEQQRGESAASETDSPTASSSSSTLRGSITPPQKDDDVSSFDCEETTPLLVQNNNMSPSPRRPSLLNRLRSFLMYQPRPVRALTAPANVLPANGTSLLVVLFLAVNMFYLLYRMPGDFTFVFILADRAGLVFVVNLPILYVLAAKTNQPLKALTGWSYEGLNLFHRRLGEWMVAVSVIHMLGMFAVWYAYLRSLGYTLSIYLSSKVVYMGLLTIVSYYIIYVTSVGWFRQLYYELFLGLHILFQVSALAFLFFHYPTAKPYVVATLAVWAVDRLLWRMTMSSRRFIATLEVAPDNHTVLVHCDVDLRRKMMGIRSHLHHGWLPGQHVFLTVPAMGFKYRFQAHPFTIASPAPPQDAGAKSWPLQLVIRSIDGFSLDLLNYARHHQHCEVILDGPHGGVEALEAARHADRVCFVAGGSGIAVTYPLAWSNRVQQSMQAQAVASSRAVYKGGVKVVPSIVDRGPLIAPSRYAHFWVRQDPFHREWITMYPRASSVKVYDQETLDSMFNHTKDPVAEEEGEGDEEGDREDTVSLITRAFDTRLPGPEGGRPDMQSEIWNWATSVPAPSASASASPSSSRSSSSMTLSVPSPRPSASKPVASRGSPRSHHKICIVVSGPDGLVRDVRNVAAQLVLDGWDVDVWVEKFGW